MTDLNALVEQLSKGGGSTVDDQLDTLIERRYEALSRAAPNGTDDTDPSWQKSVDKLRQQQLLDNRYEWHLYHRSQAERHRRTLQELIDYHEGEAAKLAFFEKARGEAE